MNDLTGKKFGRLTIVSDSLKRDSASIVWTCFCECGNTCDVSARNLKNNHTKSCGCLSRETTSKIFYKHGMSSSGEDSVEYHSYNSMKQRCYNPISTDYPNYGGRGITVCDRWLGENGFPNFLEDMGLRPSVKHSLDRFPNNETGIYEKSNCRWATKREQALNRRSNVFITFNGITRRIGEWAIITGIDVKTLYQRRSRGSFCIFGVDFKEQHSAAISIAAFYFGIFCVISFSKT